MPLPSHNLALADGRVLAFAGVTLSPGGKPCHRFEAPGLVVRAVEDVGALVTAVAADDDAPPLCAPSARTLQLIADALGYGPDCPRCPGRLFGHPETTMALRPLASLPPGWGVYNAPAIPRAAPAPRTPRPAAA